MLLLRGATRSELRRHVDPDVSIHAPLARSNLSGQTLRSRAWFQYMLLLRGATEYSDAERKERVVSIHAPLARSNKGVLLLWTGHRFVSIHAPLARSNGRVLLDGASSRCFNTCSSCEEQLEQVKFTFNAIVSIHAPLARSNFFRIVKNVLFHEFQYMLLLRGATYASPTPK